MYSAQLGLSLRTVMEMNMPNFNDRVTLFLNATNTTVAVMSLAFVVWLQIAHRDVPVEIALATCEPTSAMHEVNTDVVKLPPIIASKAQ